MKDWVILFMLNTNNNGFALRIDENIIISYGTNFNVPKNQVDAKIKHEYSVYVEQRRTTEEVYHIIKNICTENKKIQNNNND